MAYKVLQTFWHDGKEYVQGADFAASEHDARPLLMQGLIAEIKEEVEVPKPKVKRRGA